LRPTSSRSPYARRDSIFDLSLGRSSWMGSGVKADSMPLAVVMIYLLVIIMRAVRSG
jgi:hypothetical protein